MMERFTFAGMPQRALFGAGTLAETPAEVARLGRSRALVLTTARQKPAGEALAVKVPYPNPRAFSQADIRALLQNAWDGVRP